MYRKRLHYNDNIIYDIELSSEHPLNVYMCMKDGSKPFIIAWIGYNGILLENYYYDFHPIIDGVDEI